MSLIENLLPERFEVVGELGRGGTSVVLRARDKLHDREVAVKILLKDTEEDRFQREAERLASLSHPNVVSFLEVGRHGGRDFLVMEYLEMGDLASYVPSLSVIEILRIFIQICDGLAHLHDRGIVHRDIKPANILVDRTGRPKITDLGVARHMERNTRLTQAGTILGTYSYLAPEQILSSTVGPKADLYSLGICLFTALTGRRPFEAGNEFTMLKAHLEEPAPSLHKFLPEAPDSLERLLHSLLAKEEEDRPRSARAVADLLGECIQDLEAKNQENLQPVWEEKIEELPEDQRSVLLAITYLGSEATFDKVCQATPFSEDKTDRLLEELLKGKLIDSPTGDRFLLNFPQETIQTRLTPRLRSLFAKRLSDLSDNAAARTLDNPSVQASVRVEEPTVVSSGPVLPEVVVAGLAAAREEALAPEIVTMEPVAPRDPTPPPKPPSHLDETPLASTAQRTEPLSAKPTHGARQPKKPQVSPAEPLSRPRWVLLSLSMLMLGVCLAGGSFWYWAHSASLAITSQPVGARVLLNGREMGVTPMELDRLKPGSHAVALALEHHRGVDEMVELGFQQQQERHFTLEPIVGKLLLTIKPSDASITIDGNSYGVVNSDLVLQAGKHKLQATKQGFEAYSSEIQIEENEALEVEVRLTPIVAQVEVTSEPSGALVTLDGNKVGKTPTTLKNVSFGRHEVAVLLQGHERALQTVEVSGQEKKMTVKAKLKELPGGLMVSSDPLGAELKVNGEVKGKTPQTLTGLKAGKYTVTLNRAGYHPVSEQVTVKAGEEIKKTYALGLIARPAEPAVVSQPRYEPAPRYNPEPAPVYRPAPPRNPGGGGNPWTIE